jgi:hypothetical protein
VPRKRHQKLAFLGVSHSAFGGFLAFIPSSSSLTGFVAARRRRAAEQRDELVALHLIEFHSVPSSQAGLQDNRISEDQSGGHGDQR